MTATDLDKKGEAILAKLRKICMKLPGAMEGVIVHHPAFRAGKKPFAVLGGVPGDYNIAFKADVFDRERLRDDPRCFPTPYMAHNGWLSLKEQKMDWDDLAAILTRSYRLTAGKKLLAQLDSQ